jgi:hypothetical protein
MANIFRNDSEDLLWWSGCPRNAMPRPSLLTSCVYLFSGWLGVTSLVYGLDVAMRGAEVRSAPWFVIAALLLAVSFFTRLSERRYLSQRFNNWIDKELSQIREAQSINADTLHEDLANQVKEITNRLDEVDNSISFVEDHMHKAIESKSENIMTEIHIIGHRVEDIDRALGDLMRNCEKNCPAKK